MGYFRAHHKKKGKCEKSQIAHMKPFMQVKGKPYNSHGGEIWLAPDFWVTPDLHSLLHNWDKGKCCDTDSCNDGKGNCNGSCNRR